MSGYARIFAADDWGMSPAINLGILKFAERGWLRSVSLMANAPYVSESLSELLKYAATGLEFSLHLNFTYGRPISPPGEVATLVRRNSGLFHSHGPLIVRGISRRIAPADVVREFEAQLSKLQALKIAVSGVDGHHHVHLLPGVAGPLHQALLRQGLKRVRIMVDPRHRSSYLQTRFFKKFLIRENSGLDLQKCNYLLPRDLKDAKSLRRKISLSTPSPLLVHLALYDDFVQSGMHDPLQAARVRELRSIVSFLHS